MAVSAFKPIIFSTPSPSFTIPTTPHLSTFTPTRNPKSWIFTQQSLPPIAALSDPFVLQIAESLEDSLPSSSSHLQKLRDFAAESLLSTPWPSRKDEPFRFTDTSFIKNSDITPVSSKKPQSLNNSSVFEDTLLLNLTIIDGYIVDSLSQLSGLPDGVFVGSLFSIDSVEITKRVLEFLPVNEQGDLFWSLNGVGSPDLVVVYVPEGCRFEGPLHLRYVSSEGSDKDSRKLPVSNPRVLVVVEKGGEVGIVEEFMSGDGGGGLSYWTNSVMEVVIGEEAKVSHSYIQTQSLNSAHIKWTSIRQEKSSTYELVEVSTGGKLSRHNVHVQQVGSDTITWLSTFHLSVCDQTQDLHSKIVLDHPRGFSRQLHKCIVAHPLGQAVFDGNVKVNRYAQQTDAGQLTRSLILEPRATVNVKPNLQIIADDVKCSHGAAICDLEEDQLFYLQARGIDLKTARKALIVSFAAEVIDRFPSIDLRKKVDLYVKKLLDPEVAVNS